MNDTKPSVHQSTGNVFADLKLRDPDAHKLKAVIVAELYRLTKSQKLTQASAGELMGIPHHHVSRLFRGHFRHYSLDRLIAFLTILRPDDMVSSLGPGHISFVPVQPKSARGEGSAPNEPSSPLPFAPSQSEPIIPSCS